MAPSLFEKMRRVGWPTRLISLLAVAVLCLAGVVAVLVTSDNAVSRANATDASEADGGTAVTTDGGADMLGAVDDGGRVSTSVGSTGSRVDAAVVLDTIDPVASAALAACSQFRAGATVDRVATWFVDGWAGSSREAEALFREIVERAITMDCPEVVPSG